MSFEKYTFVCDPTECDALLEFTARDGFDFPNGVVQMQCPCGRRMQWIQKQTEQKGSPLVDTTEKDTMVAMWRQELELTYGNQITELQNKISILENSKDMYRNSCNNLQSNINKIIDNLTEDYWYNPNTDKETVLSDLCEIIGHTPKKTISFTATMNFTGSIEIDLSDAEDFDLEDVLSEAYVDINNGDVEIDGYELYDASEC